MAGDRIDFFTGTVFAKTRTEDDDASQCGPATDVVDDGLSGEIPETKAGEETATPDPVADDRVDEQGQDERKENE